MHPQRIALLQAMPIFGAISTPSLEFLVARAQPIHVPAGASFFRQGDDATGMYVLEQGQVAICCHRQGRDFALATLGAGDCFGEMALMDLHPRSASAHAQQACDAIEIKPDDLYALFEQDCAQFALIQMNMGREVCRRLRAADERLFALQAGLAGPAASCVGGAGYRACKPADL